MDISNFRKDYLQSGLNVEDLNLDPNKQFEEWFQQAINVEINEPNAMSFATVSKEGVPSLRTVLLKYFDKNGYVFFTNYNSSKAKDIEENPNVSMLFPWISLERQIIIKGKAEKISKAESLKYYITRPHGSQLGAWISDQSSVISSRNILEMKLQQMKEKFSKGMVPIPDFWGGFRIVPQSFEFWQGRTNRLHDRFLYSKSENSWDIERLAP